ncbi:MAG: alpha/beta hydrolase, partial [Actinomycetota bacterium]|nr:alpha/beta hydrolase [Actinomycetota bacterium]
MRKTTALAVLTASVVAVRGGVREAERRMLDRMDALDPPRWWRVPVFPEGREIMVPTNDGAELLVGLAGDDNRPPVVLVHGITQRHHDLTFIADELLARGYRVVGVNQRGHGGSTVGTEGFSPARLGADLGQVLRALDLTDAVVCGHSMGGIAAIALATLAADHGAERMSGLALVATTARATGARQRVSTVLLATGVYERLMQHPLHGPALTRAAFGRATPARVLVDAVSDSRQQCPRAIEIAAARGLRGFDVRERLG